MSRNPFDRHLACRSRSRHFGMLLACTLLCMPIAQAQQCERAAVTDRPKIGLALGGGGARGGAHIGVLQMLDELRVPVDYIAGTSMGSIVGGLMAVGMSTTELEEVLLAADWDDLFDDATPREDTPFRRKADDDLGLYGPKLGIGKGDELLPGGAVAGQKIIYLFESLTTQRIQTKDFDQLPIPFRAVAADIITGDMVIMHHGDVSIAMRSSMSVPGAFDPVPFEGRLLVDGGIVRNLPADVVRDMGADVVIAVNVGTPLTPEEELTNLVTIVGQLNKLLIVGNTERQIESLAPQDILITPELGDEISSAGFDEIEEAIPIGYAGAEAVRDRLAALSVSEQAYRAWQRGTASCISGPAPVRFVRLENDSRFADEVIEGLINIEPGDTLDLEQLDHDIRQIYALGFIRHARYRVIEEEGQSGILIQVQDDPRGPDYIETGLDLTGSSRENSINLRAAYLKTDLDDHGAEFRAAAALGDDLGLLAEYYKPFDRGLKWVFQPQVGASRIDNIAFDETGRAVGEYEVDELTATLAFGREFGRHAGLLVGARRFSGKTEATIGDPELGESRYDGGEWLVTASYDRLDDRYVPSDGSFARLQYIHSDSGLGADDEYEQATLTWFSTRSWGRHTGWIGTTFKTTFDDNAPSYAQFSGGGFLNLSGLEANSISGQHFGSSLLGYRYKMSQSGMVPGFAGVTLEYGNAADRSSDVYGEAILNGSMYLAYDSPLGPFYIGLGLSEDHSGVFFLRLGALLGGTNIGRR